MALMQLVAYGSQNIYGEEEKEREYIKSLTPIQRKLYLKKKKEEEEERERDRERRFQEFLKREEEKVRKMKEKMEKYCKNIIVGIGYSERYYGVGDHCWCIECEHNYHVRNTWMYCFKKNKNRERTRWIFEFAFMLRRMNIIMDKRGMYDKWDEDLIEAYNSEGRYDNVMYVTEDRNEDKWIPKLYIEEYYDWDGYGDILYHGYRKQGYYNVTELFRIRRVLRRWIRRRRAGKKIVKWAREIGENPHSANPFIVRVLCRESQQEIENYLELETD